ncbi:hypothetical protein GCM10017557_53410 [Streptomyces aurantiacus]|uniref:Uncharacterized protein n=1 Tax=Streptomyces aurantiacus TaxID=47760 RepID=A0A7G1P624_9ACTN|nr:hypothetical protein GCM10017557_53410 [Streptomyces aurantiacus]
MTIQTDTALEKSASENEDILAILVGESSRAHEISEMNVKMPPMAMIPVTPVVVATSIAVHC